jgi:DNA-binding HxlR family transcriptional regulator
MTRSIKKDTYTIGPSAARGKYARTGYVSPIDATLEVIGGKYKVANHFHLRDGARRPRKLAPGLMRTYPSALLLLRSPRPSARGKR